MRFIGFSTLFFLLVFAATPLRAQGMMNITSPLFEEGGILPLSAVSNERGCDGDNISPPLQWSGAPEGTGSYALSMYDPDGHQGQGTLHWVVFNIPLTTGSLPMDSGSGKDRALPYPAHSIANSFGRKRFDGACPPAGKMHRYQFSVYAMRDKLAFYPLSAIGKPTVKWLRENSLGHTTITVNYKR